MKTMREKLTEAAFWEKRVCPKCGEAEEDEKDTTESECCDETLVNAAAVLFLMGRVEEEEEG